MHLVSEALTVKLSIANQVVLHIISIVRKVEQDVLDAAAFAGYVAFNPW